MNATLVDSITSIGTLLTAIAALLTILEMRRQRLSGQGKTGHKSTLQNRPFL